MTPRLAAIIVFSCVTFVQSHAQDFTCGQANMETAALSSNLNTFPVYGGRHLPATGVVRAFVVYVQFKDHTTADPNWPVNSLPNWAASFVDSVADGNYPAGSLTQRYHQWSGGQYHLIGNYFNRLVITSKNSNLYDSLWQVNKEVLDTVDQYVNFALYDSLNRTGNYQIVPGTDNLVDLILIVYRGAPQGQKPHRFWGISQLSIVEGERFNTNDGKTIEAGFPGSGVTLVYDPGSGRVTPFEDAVGIAVHEVGHKLFGAFHFIHNFAMLGSMSSEWGGSAFNAIERRWLGWGNDFLYANNSQNTITLRDFFTTGDAAAVKIGTANNEWLVLENRQRTDPYDRARATGLYIYHFGESTDSRSLGMIRILSADGMWNWVLNASTNQVEKSGENVVTGSSKLELVTINNINYRPPGFPGDSFDGFNVGYKTVLSSTTNPRAYTRNGNAITTRVELLSTSNGVMTVSIANPPPPAPLLADPTNNATGVSGTPTFRWNRSLGATSYLFQLSDNVNFTTTKFSETRTDTFFTVSDPTLLYGTRTYYWRVNATNLNGTSNWSDTWSFTIGQPLLAPTLVAPSNGAGSVPTTVTFQWRRVSQATSYRFDLSKSLDFTINNLQINVAVSDTVYTVSGLDSGATYYWRVRSRDNYGSSESSATWSFTTVSAPPPAPALASPANGATDVSITPTLSWNASNGAGAYKRVDFFCDSQYTSNIIARLLMPPGQHTIPALPVVVAMRCTSGGTGFFVGESFRGKNRIKQDKEKLDTPMSTDLPR